MDSKITEFTEGLKNKLAGLPKEEINEALNYYEEYLKDAEDSGKDLDTVLKELGSPEKIAAQIKSEFSIRKAEQSPGLRNFLNMIKYSFRALSTPLAVFGLSVLSFIPFCLVAIFFASSFVFLLAAVLGMFALAYEGVMLSGEFVLAKVGTFGAALMWAALVLLVAYLMFRCGKMFILLSVRLIRYITGKPGKPVSESRESKTPGKPGLRSVVITLAAVFVIGTIAFGISGLPWNYFMIFNSIKPEAGITKIISEYEPQDISKLSVVTAHSNIRLEQGSTDKLVFSYEKADWLDYEIGRSGSMLSFYEKSSGKLPLFRLVSLHESRTELLILLPRGFHPDMVTVESTGGHISISNLSENIMAKTYNGSIFFSLSGAGNGCNLKANTKNGKIMLGRAQTGQRVYDGIEYYKNNQSEKTAELKSTNGDITIE